MTPDLQDNKIVQQNNLSIYLADDDEDDREFFTDAIKDIDSSVTITEAKDGIELMNILLSGSEPLPDLLFLDINMPGKSGFDCLREIRRHDFIRYLKVIIFSTSHDPQNIAKAKELGADFYAVKPSSFIMLKTFIAGVLEMNWNAIGDDRSFRLI